MYKSLFKIELQLFIKFTLNSGIVIKNLFSKIK